jgi:hypothetical protein
VRPNVLLVHRVCPCDRRTSYLRVCNNCLLTMWAGRVTINNLSDDVLLHIFHSVRVTYLDRLGDVSRLWPLSWWHRLVHVCRGWRSVVFASLNSLDLRLSCGPRTRVELIGIWPPFPIVITNKCDWSIPEDYDFDAAFAHRNRVREIVLFHIKSSQLQRAVSAMQEQFPALIHLMLDFTANYSPVPAPALPDGFLGGSTPCLQSLGLQFIPFPALPKLLLSATDLVRLSLWNIPRSGYISPEAIVTALAVFGQPQNSHHWI